MNSGALRGARPTRADIEPAALRLVQRYGAHLMATARRYAQSPEDAEDAYQRGLEILLTKAPTTRESDLLPWLKVVVRHEAFALRRQRERVGVPCEATPPAAEAPAPDEHVERLERLQRGAEALRRLKPQEVRCMLLRAEGYSYKQIQEITGFSYTKVNRSLAEGRRSFARRVEGIESGAECERLAPLLSALADGEATADDMAALRPHLRTCLSCRAALRDAREAPGLAAAVACAPSLFVGGGGGVGTWVARVHERVTLLVMRVQDAAELAMAHKLAAAAASAAALAGGGAAVVASAPPGGGPPAGAERAEPAARALDVPVARQSAAIARPGRRQQQPSSRDPRPVDRNPGRPRQRAVPSTRPSPTPPAPRPVGSSAAPPREPPATTARAPAPAPPTRRPEQAPDSGWTGEFGP